MTWLAAKLNKRVQIRIPIQTPNSTGGYDRTYKTALTVWAQVIPTNNPSYIRGTQISTFGKNIQNAGTHEFTIRKIAVSTLGTEWGKGFGSGYDSIPDLRSLKSEFYLFMENTTVKGQLFKIISIKDNDEKQEYLKIRAEEIEEQGSGYQA